MKILIVTPVYWPAVEFGGPVHTVKSLAQALAARGEQVTVLTSNCGKPGRLDVPVGEPVWHDQVKVVYLNQSSQSPFGAPADLETWLAREATQADVLHVMSTLTMMTVRTCRWARRRGIPYVVTTRGHLLPWNKWKDLKKRLALILVIGRLLRASARLHATSLAEAEALRALGFQQVEPVPYGVEIPSELPQREAARAHWGITDDTQVLLYLGRLHPQKGVDLLLRAVGALGRQGNRPLLLLAGGADAFYRQHLEALAAEEGIAAQCRFLGVVTGADKWAFLRAGDLLVHLAAFESFGLAIGEALGAGVPVLIGERCGWESVAEIGAGQRVPLKVEAIANSLKSLLAEPEQLKAMGTRARTWINQEYQWSVRVDQVMEFYHRALEQ